MNAGTCEFLLAPDGTISFNEVNTRLQVEHPATELVTGVDVVSEQLRIAAGGLIAYDDPPVRGHAIEFRINGEDPGNDFLPSPGRLERWRPPSGPGVRFDGGYEEGDTLPEEFDSLLGKLIVFGRDRRQALAYARRALAEFQVEGIATVLPLDRMVVTHPDFESEPFRVHTRWIETDLTESLASLPRYPDRLEVPAGEKGRKLTLEVDGRRVNVTLPPGLVGLGGPVLPPPPARHASQRAGSGRSGASADSVSSPMQARVVKLAVKDGARVAKGEVVVEVEAMKMEQPLRSPADGWVQGLTVDVGDEVQRGEVLCRIVSTPPGEEA